MSLISLLIALAAERYLSSSAWQFNTYYSRYKKLFAQLHFFGAPKDSWLASSLFVLLPAVLAYFVLDLVSDGLLYMLVSTVILIVCFGCVATRHVYKQYLMAAFRGETTTCEMHHKQLLQDKNLPEMGFGQSLIWLNYRYFIAIMIFFVLFGAPGALLYRLLCKLNEAEVDNQHEKEECLDENNDDLNVEVKEKHVVQDINRFNQQVLFWLDWIPVRVVAFGYMLVGHFSKAMPVWLENLFDGGKLPHNVLISVAQKSEDFMVDLEDCTAEPCLLVRLAKRTLLLCLAVIAILILTGVIQ